MGGKMAKIIIIDDDSDLLKFMTACLKDVHDVVLATSGEEGLMLAKTTPFDVILTDIFMPTKDGLEVVRELVKWFPQIKIIAMTAEMKGGKTGFLDFAMHLGAVAKLVKPFSPVSLRQTIDEVLAS
jgi:CheY-like chemotaxis protein